MAIVSQKHSNQPVTKSSFPLKWEKAEIVFTGDELIDAYFMGIEDGKNSHKSILTKKFHSNIEAATQLSEKLFKQITALKFHPQEIHLKAEDITKFKALIVVSKDDFLSDNFNKAYTTSRKIMNESENEDFCIIFSFTYASDKLNEQCLMSDGFLMKYDPKHGQA